MLQPRFALRRTFAVVALTAVIVAGGVVVAHAATIVPGPGLTAAGDKPLLRPSVLCTVTVSPAAPKQGATVAFAASVTRVAALLKGQPRLFLYHLESAAVTEVVAGRGRTRTVRLWRLKPMASASADSSLRLTAGYGPLSPGKWQVRFSYEGSPACYATRISAVRTFTVQDARIEAAIRWCMSHLGSHRWDHYCMRFVNDAYENCPHTTVQRYTSARQAAGALHASEHRGYDAPRGAYVFFDSPSGNGHVGISLGNGTMIHDYGSKGVVVTPIRCSARYLGWAAPCVTPRIIDWDQPSGS